MSVTGKRNNPNANTRVVPFKIRMDICFLMFLAMQ